MFNLWRNRNGKHRRSDQAQDGDSGSHAGSGGGPGAWVAPAVYSTWGADYTGGGPTRASNHGLSLALLNQIQAQAVAQQQAHAQIMQKILLTSRETREPFKAKIPRTDPEIGEIAAYRIWKNDNGVLRSITQSTPWFPGQIMKAEFNGDDEAGYAAGIYAMRTVGDALEMAREYEMYWRNPFQETIRHALDAVIGKVHLWGEVVEHEHGYRAEYCKIVSFLKAPPEIVKAYDVPLRTHWYTRDENASR